MHRFYYKGPIKAKSSIVFTKDEMHHLKKVMRVEKGDSLEVVNGCGALAICTYRDPEIFVEEVKEKPRPPYTKTLIQAYAEPKHLELIVEKGTELGIDAFCFFRGDKSSLKDISPAKQERLDKITISALKQCKRLYLPTISYYQNLQEITPPGELFFGEMDGADYHPKSVSRAFCIGPESGFSPREKALLQDTMSAKPTKIADNVLRCETAAIIASHLLCFG